MFFGSSLGDKQSIYHSKEFDFITESSQIKATYLETVFHPNFNKAKSIFNDPDNAITLLNDEKMLSDADENSKFKQMFFDLNNALCKLVQYKDELQKEQEEENNKWYRFKKSSSHDTSMTNAKLRDLNEAIGLLQDIKDNMFDKIKLANKSRLTTGDNCKVFKQICDVCQKNIIEKESLSQVHDFFKRFIHMITLGYYFKPEALEAVENLNYFSPTIS